MAMREELDRLVEEMVTKGIRYEEAQREFEKRFISRVLLKAEGNLRLACHAIEFVVLAAPDSQAAHALRADIYATRAALEVSSMGRNILHHAALASREGKRDLAGGW